MPLTSLRKIAFAILKQSKYFGNYGILILVKNDNLSEIFIISDQEMPNKISPHDEFAQSI
jgi:hypothetical protein